MPDNRIPRRTKLDAFRSVADSHLFALYEQDRVPSPQEKAMIQELLENKTAHLVQLNSQVPRRSSGKKVPRELRIELDSARRSIKFHRALISPWRRLPVEIVSEIFCLTLEARENYEDDAWKDDAWKDDAWKDDAWKDDRAGTLLLCKICSAWRAIAIQTPALWNVLSLNARYANRHPLDWVSTWLDRSRSFPVYLQLVCNLSLPDVIDSVLSIFASHLHHTAGLRIDLTADFSSPDIIDNLYHKLTFKPLVETPHAPLLSIVSVNIAMPTPSRNNVWDWIHGACRASPHLTHLATSHFALDSFPVANLTRLDLFRPVAMSQVFQIFEHASNLEKVYLEIEGPVTTSSPRSILGMKSVSTMRITSEDHFGEFLEQTEFPSLVYLCVHMMDDWPAAAFQSFLSRSSCALKTLRLDDCDISQEEIIACLQHKACNSLESLVVEDCYPESADALLLHLTYDPERPLSNPNLREIQLREIRATDGLLSALVHSRLFTTASRLPSSLATPVRLKKVRFSFANYWVRQKTDNPEDWKRLREIEKTGDGSEPEIIWPDDGDWFV